MDNGRGVDRGAKRQQRLRRRSQGAKLGSEINSIESSHRVCRQLGRRGARIRPRICPRQHCVPRRWSLELRETSPSRTSVTTHNAESTASSSSNTTYVSRMHIEYGIGASTISSETMGERIPRPHIHSYQHSTASTYNIGEAWDSLVVLVL